MDAALYPIIPVAIENPLRELGKISGQVGRLEMIQICDLRVDGTYQRNLTQGGVKNIRKIVREFDWAKFLPVIVVCTNKGFYSIIDGQHRTTAAATLGIEKVPCYILDCSVSEAAGAFAAINGNVVPMSPVDLWFARLAAADPEAIELQRSLDAADVCITRKKEGTKVGETRSINVLRRAHKAYGAETLIMALQCITQTGDGNPGLIVGSTIHGIACAIRAKNDRITKPSAIFDIFDMIDLGEMLQRARVEQAQTGNLLQAILTREINRKLRDGGVS